MVGHGRGELDAGALSHLGPQSEGGAEKQLEEVAEKQLEEVGTLPC